MKMVTKPAHLLPQTTWPLSQTKIVPQENILVLFLLIVILFIIVIIIIVIAVGDGMERQILLRFMPDATAGAGVLFLARLRCRLP